MKSALWVFAYGLALNCLGFFIGMRYGKEHPPEPPVCTAICTPYSEAATIAEEAAERCDRQLLTCLSWQVVIKQDVEELQGAFVNFKNAIVGCAQ